MRMCMILFAIPVLIMLFIGTTQAVARAASLMASTQQPAVGQTVTFTYDGVNSGPGPLVIAFGDGSTTQLPSLTGTTTHTYRSIGFYSAKLCEVSCFVRGGILSVVGLLVAAPAPRVPFGTIVGTSILGGPFLAGAVAQINVSFRIASQFQPFSTTPQNDLEAVVDLQNEHGDLIRRSDPLVIPSNVVTGGVLVQQVLDYTIPNDAAGAYQIVVYLRTDNGATVAVGQPTRIVILGGPDPAPIVKNEFHASGTIVTGPSTTTFGSSTPSTSTQFQSNLTTAFVWPGQTLSLTGLYDPVSRRSDPVLTLTPTTQSALSSPDSAAPQPAGSPAPGGTPQYVDTLGRTTAALPNLLGGGDTIRGLDLTYKYDDGWTYQGAAGYTQLGSPTTSLRTGDALDVMRSWGTSDSDSLRLTYFAQADDVAKFVPNGSAGPMSANATVMEFTDQVARDLTAVISGGASSSHLETGAGTTSSDAADKAGLQYTLGSVNVAANYHNYGADFAVGGGPGAVSDTAGSDATASANVSPISTVSLAWLVDSKRSAFSRHSDETGAFSMQPPNGFGLVLTATHDRMLVAGSALTADTLAYGISRSWMDGASLALNGTASRSIDALHADSSSIVQTNNLTYALQKGSHMFGAGLSSNVVLGNAQNTTETGNVNYGFGFGGASGPTPAYEMQLSAMGGDTTGFRSVGRISMYTAILSRHLSSHVALGLRAESGSMLDPMGFEPMKTSSVQLQMNLNY
jgi:hypothetical protein